jgi:hypothetical protein
VILGFGCKRAQAAEAAVRAGVRAGGGAALPGMIFNQSKTVAYTDAGSGRERCVRAGRMECTMQARRLFALPTKCCLA